MDIDEEAEDVEQPPKRKRSAEAEAKASKRSGRPKRQDNKAPDQLLKSLIRVSVKLPKLADCFKCMGCQKNRVNIVQTRTTGKPPTVKKIESCFRKTADMIMQNGGIMGIEQQQVRPLFMCGTCSNKSINNSELYQRYEEFCNLVGVPMTKSIEIALRDAPSTPKKTSKRTPSSTKKRRVEDEDEAPEEPDAPDAPEEQKFKAPQATAEDILELISVQMKGSFLETAKGIKRFNNGFTEFRHQNLYGDADYIIYSDDTERQQMLLMKKPAEELDDDDDDFGNEEIEIWMAFYGEQYTGNKNGDKNHPGVAFEQFTVETLKRIDFPKSAEEQVARAKEMALSIYDHEI